MPWLIKAVLSVQHENSKKRKVRTKGVKVPICCRQFAIFVHSNEIPKDTIIEKLTCKKIHKIRIQRVQKREKARNCTAGRASFTST